jgi:hypothetical protein
MVIMAIEHFLGLSSFDNSPGFIYNLALYIFYVFAVMFTLFYDQSHLSRGIRTLAPIQFTWNKKFLADILNLLISYFVITFYAIIMVNCLISPFIISIKTIPPENMLPFLIIFMLSAGVIVRWTYVLSSTAFGSVLWDFYAVPGIFLAMFLFLLTSADSSFLPYFLLIEIGACSLGVIFEVVLVYFRKRVRNVLERKYLHEILDLIPLASNVISGRKELYANLAAMLNKGIIEREGENGRRDACGTSIFFECGDSGEYAEAVKRFIGENKGKIRYVGPLTKQRHENDETWKKRKRNIENRKELGVEVNDYPLSFDSFRFLIVNQRHVSIEFPTSPPLVHIEECPKSVIAISFENGVIASMFQALFDKMWDKDKKP